MVDEPEARDEERRLRQLRLLVDVTAQVIAEDQNLTLCEALRLVEAAHTAARRLFPENTTTFDLVIRPRLDRLLLERFGIESPSPVN
ncbi:MAG: hypothetical protein ACM3O7_08080 [Acidobacteriota bacterium]